MQFCSSPRNDYTIRPYTPADETQWLRCRVLAFLGSAYFDDVKQAKTQYNNPSIALVAYDCQLFELRLSQSTLQGNENCAAHG